IDDVEADFKNTKQNNHLQTSFTAGNAMRPRQRMRTLRRNRFDGKGFDAENSHSPGRYSDRLAVRGS
ncbi:hypothetical protein, partial [Cobetia amphilecti]|uniref:hypothetical protein n=1 Tax=Cobetia amphilecti TaxID=1055104 RepID=UPI001C07F6B3